MNDCLHHCQHHLYKRHWLNTDIIDKLCSLHSHPHLVLNLTRFFIDQSTQAQEIISSVEYSRESVCLICEVQLKSLLAVASDAKVSDILSKIFHFFLSPLEDSILAIFFLVMYIKTEVCFQTFHSLQCVIHLFFFLPYKYECIKMLACVHVFIYIYIYIYIYI